MNSARLALTASAVVLALGVVAAAWAAPGTNGGASSSTGSGGARANPVVPSSGGGSEPAPDSAQSGLPPGPVPPTIEVPPVTGFQTGAPDDGAVTETVPEEELVVPLPDEDGERPGSGGAPAREGESSGGAFSFLASTGFEIATLVTIGAGLVVTGVLLRSNRRVKF